MQAYLTCRQQAGQVAGLRTTSCLVCYIHMSVDALHTACCAAETRRMHCYKHKYLTTKRQLVYLLQSCQCKLHGRTCRMQQLHTCRIRSASGMRGKVSMLARFVETYCSALITVASVCCTHDISPTTESAGHKPSTIKQWLLLSSIAPNTGHRRRI